MEATSFGKVSFPLEPFVLLVLVFPPPRLCDESDDVMLVWPMVRLEIPINGLVTSAAVPDAEVELTLLVQLLHTLLWLTFFS